MQKRKEKKENQNGEEGVGGGEEPRPGIEHHHFQLGKPMPYPMEHDF